ncbi:MAG: M14 family zinc carboxypeptidase [Anaerovorax sp.]
MNRKTWLRILRTIKPLCFILIFTLIVAVPTFAAEVNEKEPQAIQAAETGVIIPKVTFSVNSNALFLFDSTGKLIPQGVTTVLPVISVDGTTYVPIRGFCNALGYSVGYDQQTKNISINYMEKSLQLSQILTLADLSKKDVYFTLNGNSYTKIQNMGMLENLSVVKKENVLFLYGTVSTAAISHEVPIETTDGAILKTTSSGGILDVEKVFTVEENKPVLTDEWIQGIKATATAPKEAYVTTLRKAYDGRYYRPFVNPYVPYSYPQMQADIGKLKEQYPEYIRSASAGKSVEGRALTTIEFGNGNKHIYLFGSHHAREYISTTYIMKFVNESAYAAKTGINPTKYDIRNMLNQVTFHIIPMVNPDGVNLVQNGIESVSPAFREKVRAMPINDSKYGYRSWKSNINGVDLNRNYPSNWVGFKSKNASSLYPGPYPASEPEVQAVMNYMRNYAPEAIVATHSQGQLIYWSNPENQLGDIGRKIIKSSGFRPIMNRSQDAKAGFLSNYARDTYHKLEITIELCRYIGPYPYPDAQFDEVWAPAKEILLIIGDGIARK